MKKVLIITYYWPPSGGPGVQRFYYFAKYLRKFGWEPIIYTIKDGQYYDYDYNLVKGLPEGLTVLSQKAFEPHNLYKKILGKKDKKLSNNVIKDKKGLLHNISVFVRGNFFIPDARKFWIKPSVRYLKKYLKENKVDAIISTSPPQSTHVIALKLSKIVNIPWIADFRDPWTEIDYFDSLKLTSWAKNKHIKLESDVLTKSSLVTTVTKTWQKDFMNLGAKDVRAITNGFDSNFKTSDLKPNPGKFTITYIGSLNDSRNPLFFWDSIKKLVDLDFSFKEKLRIVFVGNISKNVFEYIKSIGLEEYIEDIGYVSHAEIADYSSQSDILLLIGIQNVNGVLPGKIFEYLNSKKPIFGITPKISEVARLLSETRSGLNADFEDIETMYSHLVEFWDSYNSNTLSKFTIEDKELNNYSRESLTKQLVKLLDEITTKN